MGDVSYLTGIGDNYIGRDVEWFRKAINTRISKIKREKYNRATHIKAIMLMIKHLNLISPKDAKEMSDKLANENIF